MSRKHNWLCWTLAAAAGGLYLLGLQQRRQTRQPALGAIDEPETVEACTRITHLPQFVLAREVLVRRAVRGYQHARVLDVGCGAGLLALRVAQQPEVEAVTGIDLSGDMVSKAREDAELHGADVQFLQVDAAEMPFADASFDIVVSTLSMHHWDDPLKVLREIRRVLAPGGKMLLCDLRRDAFPLALGVISVFSHAIVPEEMRRSGEPLASFHAAYTPCETAVLAVKAGWDDPHLLQGPIWWVLESTR